MRGGGCRSSPSSLTGARLLAGREGASAAPRRYTFPPVPFASRPGLRAGQPPVRARQCRAP